MEGLPERVAAFGLRYRSGCFTTGGFEQPLKGDGLSSTAFPSRKAHRL